MTLRSTEIDDYSVNDNLDDNSFSGNSSQDVDDITVGPDCDDQRCAVALMEKARW